MYSVSPTQINAQVPWEIAGINVNIQIEVNGVRSKTVTANLSPAAPGVFTMAQTGSGAGVVVHASDGALVTSANPAVPGEHLIIYCTGLGPVTNSPSSAFRRFEEPHAYDIINTCNGLARGATYVSAVSKLSGVEFARAFYPPPFFGAGAANSAIFFSIYIGDFHAMAAVLFFPFTLV